MRFARFVLALSALTVLGIACAGYAVARGAGLLLQPEVDSYNVSALVFELTSATLAFVSLRLLNRRGEAPA